MARRRSEKEGARAGERKRTRENGNRWCVTSRRSLTEGGGENGGVTRARERGRKGARERGRGGERGGAVGWGFRGSNEEEKRMWESKRRGCESESALCVCVCIGGVRVQLHRPAAQLCISTPSPPPCPSPNRCFCSSFSSGLAARLSRPPRQPSGLEDRTSKFASPSHPLRPGPRATTESATPSRGMLRCERDPQNGTPCTHPAHQCRATARDTYERGRR